ncbi:MFS general substrate transporter [Aspergillus taichungensis]|uniref:MFS general substrate transporter n=1 Tax=Aspergillus taichungensis TaxID=482145 RepID=A0A2J5HID7_9EURO|nr:MFS general substrate transporter [Aspergillus taichungensis]
MISHARQDGKGSTGTCQVIQERQCPSNDTVDEFADEKATQALNRRLVRKMDTAFLSVMLLVFFFKRVDKSIIAKAKISSFERDLDLHGTQFNTAVSMAAVGYIITIIPSNILLTRARPSIYLPCCASLWAIVAMTTAAAQNYPQIVVLRFLLGLCEGPYSPGCVFMLSCWYTKEELALRNAILHIAGSLSSAFVGLISAGVFAKMGGLHDWAGWRWLFLLMGSISLAAAFMAFVFFPDYPESSTGSTQWLLTPIERRWAIERMRRDRVAHPKSTVLDGLKSAVLDYRVWLLALVSSCHRSTTGYTTFYPSIVKGMHLGNTTITLLCTAPPHLVGAIVGCLVSWSSDRSHDRSGHIMGTMTVVTIGFIIHIAVENRPVQYFASFLYIPAESATSSLPRALIATAAGQTPEKRSCAIAIVEVITALSEVWSSYFFQNNDAPRYTKGMIILVVFSVACILSAGLMRWILRRDNRRLQARFAGTDTVPILHPL